MDFNKIQSKTKVMLLKAIFNKYGDYVIISTYEINNDLITLNAENRSYKFKQSEIYSVNLKEL